MELSLMPFFFQDCLFADSWNMDEMLLRFREGCNSFSDTSFFFFSCCIFSSARSSVWYAHQNLLSSFCKSTAIKVAVLWTLCQQRRYKEPVDQNLVSSLFLLEQRWIRRARQWKWAVLFHRQVDTVAMLKSVFTCKTSKPHLLKKRYPIFCGCGFYYNIKY